MARLLIALGVGVMVLGGIAVPAHADEYDDRGKVNGQINQSNHDLDEANQQLTQAVANASTARKQLDDARGALAAAQAARQAAQAYDAQMAVELKAAQAALAKAKADVVKGQADLDAEQKVVGSVARDAYLSRASLSSVASLAQSRSTGDLADRLQFHNQLMNTSAAAIQKLREVQRALEGAQAAQTKAEADATSAKRVAEQAVVDRVSSEKAAADQQQRVAQLSQAADSAQATAQQQVDAEKSRLAELQAQRAAVEQAIRERIAREEAARQAAAAQAAAAARAAQAAREAAAAAAQRAAAERTQQAQQAAQQAQAQAQQAQQQAQQSQQQSQQQSTQAASSTGFIRPVSGAPITSGFGMRLHPVVGIWVLHDGIDFGAGCGTPILAIASGTVTQRYWDTTGFGNRLIVDNGVIGGVAFSSGYNHAESWIVNVGQRVQQGQVLGYVGSTGYSTGCHLHLNMWRGGSIIDPGQYYS